MTLPLTLLADAEPTGDQIKTWLLVVSFLGNAFLLIQRISGRGEKREIGPNPLVVAPHPEFVTMTRFNELQEERRQNLHSLKELIEGLAKKMDALPDKIRAEVKDDMREVWERFRLHDERAARLGERIASIEHCAAARPAR